MADRWEEEAPEDLRDALREFERDVEDDTMGYERGRPTRHAERSREELKAAILAFADRAAERVRKEAALADLREAVASRCARPGGTNGR